MSNIVRKTTESTIHHQPDEAAVALLAGRRCNTLYDDLVQIAGRLSVQVGDHTSGYFYATPLDYPEDFAVEGEGAFDFMPIWTNRFCEASAICFYHLAEVGAEEELAAWRPILHEHIELLAEWLGHIPNVEELRVLETKFGFEIWVIVNNASEEIRYAIYDVEWELMRRFQDYVFDFHLIDRRGMDLSSLATFAEETLTVPIIRLAYAP